MKMHNLVLLTAVMMFSVVASAQSRALDSTSVSLATALSRPEVRTCIDTAITKHGVYESEFGFDYIETYDTKEPLFPSDPRSSLRNITHFVLTAETPARGASGRIMLEFHIEIDSGTGILGYRCSYQVR